ncbi:MAG TPA: thiamine pyrophosphate-dependent enzyme [Candidatus Binatia bacterium]|nr:thiamine pyrophosphate-dependent enzyme [Candidatus Binatia bacterium]
MKRFECLSLLAPLIKDDDLVVTTLGWVAGEWFAVRHKESNLYQVNMGMCTPLCLGLALVLPHRRVIAIESDGSVLLNLGAMTTLANKRPPNLTVIVFDNQCYMATGGLPTATAGSTDLAGMANAAGIEHSYSVGSLKEFDHEARSALQRKGPSYIVAKVEAAGKRMSTDMDGKEGKYRFVRYIEKSEGIHIIGPAAKSS